jgi:CubicO group peptidase (beta-lactamase class C family)
MRIAPFLIAPLLAVTFLVFSAQYSSQAHGQSTKVASVSPSASDTAAIRVFYRAGLERNGIVGSTLVLVENGRVVLNAMYGNQRLTPPQPVGENTTYH